MNDVREIGVLKSYINFQLLDYISEQYENGDNSAKELIDSFASRKNFEPNVLLSYISCKETTLALLAGMIFLIRSKPLPPIEGDTHKWWEYITCAEYNKDNKDNKDEKDIRIKAITIIRNSIAHWGERESGVEFGVNCTKFHADAGELTLHDDGLYLLVMQMYGYTQYITKNGNRAL